MRDRPMARPMFASGTGGDTAPDLIEFLPLPNTSTQDLESRGFPDDETEPYAGWERTPTPPRAFDAGEGDLQASLDPSLASLRASPSLTPRELGGSGSTSSDTNVAQTLNRDQPDISPRADMLLKRPESRAQDSTPLVGQTSNKRRRVTSKSDRNVVGLSLDSPDNGPSRDKDVFGIKSIISQLPSKEERARVQLEASQAQESITTKITETMSNILTSNRELELAAKKEMANEDREARNRLALEEREAKSRLVLEEMRAKNRMARGSMIVDLIRAGRSPEEARLMAHEELPDLSN